MTTTNKRKPLGQQAEELLLQLIQKEPIAVGQKIPNEFDLAERFNVGRSTVREAVKALISKGVLEVRRGDGTYVISSRTLEEDPLGLGHLHENPYTLAVELMEVRLMLEPEIAALTANMATEEEKDELVRLCNQVEEDIRTGRDHLPHDVEFHSYIAKCSGNSVVETLIPIITKAVMTFGHVTSRSLREETIRSHRAITDAICENDSIGAKCAMINHLTYNRIAIRNRIKEQNTDQV